MPDRPSVAEQSEPSSPYPIYLKGPVVKELGIPTANLPQEVADSTAHILSSGIYFGYASVGSSPEVYEMVMSYGWNPFYKNEKRSAEVHIIHHFDGDFYDEELRIVILGFIREEKNYAALQDLIDDINWDILVSKNTLALDSYKTYKLLLNKQ